MDKLKIEYKKVDDLIPYENNPRYNEDAVDYVANSIKEFGFKVPIIIDKENVIVAGHTRLLASQKLGIEEVPTILADDLSEEQVKAFRLADNKVGEMASWNFELLDMELDDINLDMSDFGFMHYNDEELENSILTNKELDINDYNDKEFECECPKCGFRFNVGDDISD